MGTHQKLISEDKTTTLIRSKGINTWEALIEYVRLLPYGRNSNRTNLDLVISEQKGSCSSKHALLKKIANLNTISNVKLVLSLYKMNQKNTPGIGVVLFENSIDFIPEAHCYLKIDDKRVDVTTSQSSFQKIENDIIEELEIQPEQVATFKVNYHKGFLKKWIIEKKIEQSFNNIWSIREQCIKNLSEKRDS